jgi:2,3-bisphosphoglycerate-dependent phosphoglycerate mutase
MSAEQILNYNIPTAVPFIYEFDRHLNPIKYYYLLGDDINMDIIKKKEDEVAK